MTPQQQAQQIRLAADILKTGHTFEYQDAQKTNCFKGTSITETLCTPVKFEIHLVLATPPDGRPLHNPDNLTAEQVGVGYRLILDKEILPEGYEYWSSGVWKKGFSAGCTVPYYNRYTSCRALIFVPWPKADPEADSYAELKAAKKAGKVIQFKNAEDVWEDIESPAWCLCACEYRIKPEPTFQLPPHRLQVCATPTRRKPCHSG